MSATDALTEALQEFLDAHAELAEWIRSRVPRYVESEIRTLGRDVQSAVDWVG